METKYRLATICLFIKAVIDDLDAEDKKQEAVKKILKACTAYVDKKFKAQVDRDNLAIIANESWDLVCEVGTVVSYEISHLVGYLYEAYEDELRVECRLKNKQIQTFINKHRSDVKIGVRANSARAARIMIECINKRVNMKNYKRQESL